MISSSGILTVDLAAIQENWQYVSSRLASAECAAVIKANAYGVGVLQVASALYGAGCKAFFVATLEEAISIRTSLPNDATLYVLGGVSAGTESEFERINALPILYTLSDVYRWSRHCVVMQYRYPCVIKLDTGMTRLGLSAGDLHDLISCLPEQSWLNPVLLMSHLACADEPEHPLNRVQLERFRVAVEKFKRYFPAIKISLANSSGTFLGDEYHFDMVRIGAALYGINPQPSKPNPLTQVISLKLPVMQIRKTDSLVTVGYAAEGQVVCGNRLAVVAGGYADGIHRTLGIKPKGMVDGVVVSAVGRIAMDSVVFDVSEIDVNPEYIDVINQTLTLDALKQENKSLGYEVLTSLGQRYLRQYLPVSSK